MTTLADIHEHAIEMPPTPGAASSAHARNTDSNTGNGEQTTDIPPTIHPDTATVTGGNGNGNGAGRGKLAPLTTAGLPRNRSFNLSPRSEDAEEARVGLLLSAAQRDNVDRVLSLLEQGVNVNACDYDRRTALHVASSDGAANVVQVLIEEGADVNAKDRFNHTPLDDAVSNGHSDIAERLRYCQGTHGSMAALESQLISAAADNNIGEAHSLLDNGVNPNCMGYDRRTPLHLAVGEGHLEMAKLLLSHKANPHAEDRWGSTPLSELQRRLTRTGDDPMQDVFKEYLDPRETVAPFFSKFALFYGFWEIVFICFFGGFIQYGQDSRSAEEVSADRALDFAITYPMFQDVHVMIFIGFGFLMVFLRKHGYMSVGLTFLLAAFVIQEYQLVRGFWSNVFTGSFGMLEIDIESIVMGDFCAGAVLITYGVVLGKVSPSQMLLLALIEAVFYSLNEEIGFYLQVADLGGSMTIHMFGAFFGVAASLVLTPKSARGNQNNAAVYHSDIFAMIGTIFLFMYWPSFNGALALGNAKPRAVINTLLSITSSTIVAFLASYTFRRERRFNMVDIQNATLAGGVAMGACCTMLIQPGSAMAIGAIAGLVSVLGFVYVQPLLERYIGLHDTCGVWNLHGMPSLVGGIASVIAAAIAFDSHYTNSDFETVFGSHRAGGRSAGFQALYQFIYICTSIGIGLGAGFGAGLVAQLSFFDPPNPDDHNAMFQDDQWWEVPHLEVPYYFDARGEISRGAANLNENDAHLKHINGTIGTGGEDFRTKAKYQRQLEAKLHALEQQLSVLRKQQRAQMSNSNTGRVISTTMRGMNGPAASPYTSATIPLTESSMMNGTMAAPVPTSAPGTYPGPMSYGHPGFGMSVPPYYPYQANDPSARLESMLARVLMKLDSNKDA